MISPDTLAAALRVDQYAAHRAMLAVRASTADDQDGNEGPSGEHAGSQAPSADTPDGAGSGSRRQGDQA